MFYNAYDLFINKRYQESLQMFTQILEEESDKRFIYWSMIFIGRCNKKLGKNPLEQFMAARDVFPDRAEAICEIGIYYYINEDFAQAEKFLREALACKRNHICVRYEGDKYFEIPQKTLADIFMKQCRFNDAEELLTSLLKTGNPELYDINQAEHNHLYSRFYNNAALEFVKAKTIKREEVLIIELTNGYDGLGDNLVFSHIPRIAKESGLFKTVLVSTRNKYKGEGYAELVWGTNPYVDGFTDLPGTYSSIQMNRVLEKWNNIQPSLNLMDSIMLLHDLDNGVRGNKPECYYKPNTIELVKGAVVLDPNSKTIPLDLIDPNKFMDILEKNNVVPDYIIVSPTSLKSIDLPEINVISPSSIYEWADIICSAREYVCFNSGGYWLSAALGVKAKHIWIEGKNLPAWSYLDHGNIKMPLSTISRADT